MVEDRNSSLEHNKPLEASELINGATFDAPLLSQLMEGAGEQQLHHYHEPAKNNGTTHDFPVALLDNGAPKASRSPHPSEANAGNNNYTSKSNQAQQQPLNANNIFLTSKESFKTPLISQEKFHWSPVSAPFETRASFCGPLKRALPSPSIQFQNKTLTCR